MDFSVHVSNFILQSTIYSDFLSLSIYIISGNHLLRCGNHFPNKPFVRMKYFDKI